MLISLMRMYSSAIKKEWLTLWLSGRKVLSSEVFYVFSFISLLVQLRNWQITVNKIVYAEATSMFSPPAASLYTIKFRKP